MGELLIYSDLNKNVFGERTKRDTESVQQEVNELIAQALTELIEQVIILYIKEKETDNFYMNQVCKKLAKGKSFSQIADDCELTEEETLPFYSVAQRYAPDYNVDQIFTEYWTQKYPDISKLEDIINIASDE